MLFAIDPHGLTEFDLAPEEVELITYETREEGSCRAAFHFSEEYKNR